MTPTCIGWSQIFLPCSMWMSHKYLKQLQIWKYLHLQRRWQKSVLLFCSPFLYYVIWSGVNLDTSFSTIESITSNSLSSAKRMIMSLPCLKPLMVFNYIWIKIYNPSVTYKDIHNLILATHWFSFTSLHIQGCLPILQDFVHVIPSHPSRSCRSLLKYLSLLISLLIPNTTACLFVKISHSFF